MKNQFRIKPLPCLVEKTDAVCKSFVIGGLVHPNKITNHALVGFNDKSPHNVRFINVNSLTASQEHLTPRMYVNIATVISVDESSLFRLDLDEELKLDEQDSLILNSNLT